MHNARSSLSAKRCHNRGFGTVLFNTLLVALVVQVGYWKDLLEIVVKMGVSPQELRRRAQQGADRKSKAKGKKNNAITEKDKQKVSHALHGRTLLMLSLYNVFMCAILPTAYDIVR